MEREWGATEGISARELYLLSHSCCTIKILQTPWLTNNHTVLHTDLSLQGEGGLAAGWLCVWPRLKQQQPPKVSSFHLNVKVQAVESSPEKRYTLRDTPFPLAKQVLWPSAKSSRERRNSAALVGVIAKLPGRDGVNYTWRLRWAVIHPSWGVKQLDLTVSDYLGSCVNSREVMLESEYPMRTLRWDLMRSGLGNSELLWNS